MVYQTAELFLIYDYGKANINLKHHKFMTNILVAYKHILDNPEAEIKSPKAGNNRITNMGYALEGFVKDSLAGLLNQKITNRQRQKKYSQYLSWTGNQNNPPDLIIKNGDAVEIKKIQSLATNSIALNSSYPKQKLFRDDPRIATGALKAEEWSEKDLIYAIGAVSEDLKRLWFIYGDCYAAEKHVYERLTNIIDKGIHEIPSVEFHQTNELANVKRVDPLGITTMRVRGMWHIVHPSKLYADLVSPTNQRQYYLLMREEKYRSFDLVDRQTLEQVQKPGYLNRTIEIKDPDNPANFIQARFLSYEF